MFRYTYVCVKCGKLNENFTHHKRKIKKSSCDDCLRKQQNERKKKIMKK